MSTIKVNKIENTNTTAGGVEIDSSGHVQVDGLQMPTAGALSSRNLIINGAMNVAQRGTQVTGITTADYRTCDRIYANVSNLGTWTADQSTDAPNGFSNSFKLTCTTADASPAASDYVLISQKIEAQNLQHLNYGTSSAASLTVSFWVKSNKTGNASFGLIQPDASFRNVSKSYTINTADTWEYKTITFPGDTSGQIDNDNDNGLLVSFWLNSGSTFTGASHQTSWGAQNNPSRNASNLGVGGAVSDYFAITGFQLEVGEKATPYEHRAYSDELARCQRYYQRVSGTVGNVVFCNMSAWSSSSMYGYMPYQKTMRAAPTITDAGNFEVYSGGASPSVSSLDYERISVASCRVYAATSGLTTGRGGWLEALDSTGATIEFSAEL